MTTYYRPTWYMPHEVFEKNLNRCGCSVYRVGGKHDSKHEVVIQLKEFDDGNCRIRKWFWFHTDLRKNDDKGLLFVKWLAFCLSRIREFVLRLWYKFLPPLR